MPAYPYASGLALRPSFRSRKLFRRGLVVLGFLAALLVAALLHGI